MPVDTLRQLLDPQAGMDVSAFTEPLRAFLGAYAEQRGQRLYVESPFYAMLLSVRGGWLVLPTVVLHIMGWTHHACGGAVRTVAVSRCTLHSFTIKAVFGRSRAHPLGDSAAHGILVLRATWLHAPLHALRRQWWTKRGAC